MEDNVIKFFIEVLKLGLPGLVFLLAWFSFRLLSKEQKKPTPDASILGSIRFYMYVSLALALLTLLSPVIDNVFIEKLKVYHVEARAANDASQSLRGEIAGVCHDARYANRYLLVKDIETGKLIQVFAACIMPCPAGDPHILLTDEAKGRLGWASDKNASTVEIASAPPGLKFILLESPEDRSP